MVRSQSVLISMRRVVGDDMDKTASVTRPFQVRSGSPLPVNGSIRLPNGDSFRYVRSDILRDAIDHVTHRDTRKAK